MNMVKEVNVKEIILRLLAGAKISVQVENRNEAWLYVGKKGRIRLNEFTVTSLVQGDYLKRINKDKKSKVLEYKFNYEDRIRGISKISKEELNVFIMYVWGIEMHIGDDFYGTTNDQVDLIFTLIHKLFYIWYRERSRYLSKLRELLEEDD